MEDENSKYFYMNGIPIPFRPGQTIAEALLAYGIKELRQTDQGQSRGIFCAMGLCGECRVIINGLANCYSCQEPAREDLHVETQYDADLGGRV